MGVETYLVERLGVPVGVATQHAASLAAGLREQLADTPSGWSPLEDALRRDHLRWLLPGLPDHAVDLLVALSDGLAPPVEDKFAADGDDSAGNHDGARERRTEQALADAADATVQLGRLLEASQLELLAAMATSAGRRLLRTEHGTDDPADLSRTKQERWRARTKSVVANELQALSGYGIQDCHDRVGFALGPRTATAPADAALRRGDADWWQVWQWWKRCRPLDPDRAADVSHLVFGPPVSPGDASLPTRRPSRREFMNLLDREATRVEGTDAVAARARRHRAVEERRADATVDADGTGCFRVIGRTSAVVAAMDRVDTIARKARAAGDSRSLDQLRSDAALALLMGGVLSPAPSGVGGDDSLEVAAGGGWDPADIDMLTALLAGHPAAVIEVVVPYDVLTGADPDGVGLLTGHGSLTGEHVREIALAPGTTFHRLVTDPTSGQLLDRSAGTYAPDAEMRAIIAAADRYCRGPGCTIPATKSETDHVLEYPSGPTSIGNLSSAHSRHHGMKTNKWWSCVMDPGSRVVRWTTFFGRVYPTRPFDYSALTGRVGKATGDDVEHREHLADLQDQLVYAALADRPPGSTLGEDDDGPHSWRPAWSCADEHAGVDRAAPEVRLTHTPPGGETRPGAPPNQPAPEELVTGWGLSAAAGDGADEASRIRGGEPDPDDDVPPF